MWQVYPECQDNHVSYCGDLATPHTQSDHILAHLQKYLRQKLHFPPMWRRAVFITKLAQDAIFCHNPRASRWKVLSGALAQSQSSSPNGFISRHTRSGERRSYRDPTYDFCKFLHVVLTVNWILTVFVFCADLYIILLEGIKCRYVSCSLVQEFRV